MEQKPLYRCRTCHKEGKVDSFVSLDDLAITIYNYCLADLEGKKTPAQKHEEKFVQGFVEAYKKDILSGNACLSFTLYIKDAEELDKNEVVPHPHYPFIHGTISAPAKNVSDDVQDIFEIRWEDIEPFVNQYVLSNMHNAYCSLVGYDGLTKRALDRENSKVLFYEPDELKFMQDRGLTEQSEDGYVTFKNVGQLVTKEGDKFVPVQFKEIPAFTFSDWLDKQDDIVIIDDDAGDFWYYQKQVNETLNAFKNHPLLWYTMPLSDLLNASKTKNNTTLEDFGENDAPENILACDKDSVTVNVSDVVTGEPKELKITIGDVIEYYVTQARDMSSGMRSLAGHYGDWRPIPNLAGEVLEYFKSVNVEELRSEARRRGLEPKF